MKSSIRYFWLASGALVALLAIAGTSSAQSQESLDKRLTLVEHKLDNAALGEMANQMEALRQQIQNLRGENEQMQRQLQDLKERQRNIYADIDSRLRQLEQGNADHSSNAGSQNPPASSTASPKTGKQVLNGAGISPDGAVNGKASAQEGAAQKQGQAENRGGKTAARNGSSVDSVEYEAYERAFTTLKEGRYAKSQQEFNEFLQRYPNGQYADNARYWLGESYYVGRHFDQALGQFQKVLDNFPHSTKRAGAQLKIGFIQFEQGKLDQARKTLGEVIQRYPDSTAASLAQQRLRLIDSGQR